MRVLAAGRRHVASRWRAWVRFVWSVISITPPGLTSYPKWMLDPSKPKVQMQTKIFGVGFDWATFKEGSEIVVFSAGGHTEHAAPIVREWPLRTEPEFDVDWQRNMGVDLYQAFPDTSDPWPKMDLTIHTCTGDDSCIFCPPVIERPSGATVSWDLEKGFISEHMVRFLAGMEISCARDDFHEGPCVNLNVALGEE